MTMNWFEVDRSGLAEIAKRRGMAFIVTEPVQNAWDEEVTRVGFTLEPVEGVPYADLTVTDDSPNGFRDLADSYKMFRQSYKLADPEQRGRFNIGEKLLLAVAKEARIDTTTGSVIFGPKGRTTGRKRTERGSVLTARLRMTRAELEEALKVARTLIPPPEIATTINRYELPRRSPLATGVRSLETEARGEEGGFSYRQRSTEIRVYKPLKGETPSLYEMGIPIDEVAFDWHIEVMQKVPLSVDRSSVRSGFVTRLVRYATEIMAPFLNEEQARSSYASTALEFMEDDEAVRKVVRKRFGKAVTFDPSAPEANKRALDAGYKVVHGGELSRFAWDSVRRAEALKPAGKLFDTGRVEHSPDGVRPVPRSDWTPEMERLARYVAAFSEHVLDRQLGVQFYENAGGMEACCGGGRVSFNMSAQVVREALRLAKDKYVMKQETERLDDLLIHECAHVRGGEHLTDRFEDELSRIGAKLRTFNEEF